MTNEAILQPDTSQPSEDRQTELEAAYQANVDEGKSPYENVRIGTLGELRWVIGKREWSRKSSNYRVKDRFNFTSADLSDANLQGYSLKNMIFHNANLKNTNLSIVPNSSIFRIFILLFTIIARSLFLLLFVPFTIILEIILFSSSPETWSEFARAPQFKIIIPLSIVFSLVLYYFMRKVIIIYVMSPYFRKITTCDLSGANLEGAKFQFQALAYANFRDANLTQTDFFNADLTRADFRGAKFDGTILGSANFSASRIDSIMQLSQMRMDSRTQLNFVEWVDLDTLQKSWRGNEIQGLFEASEILRTTAISLREKGLNSQSSVCRLLAQRTERKAYLRDLRVGAWFGSYILDVAAGYGEQPERAFTTYLGVNLFFSLIYWELGQFNLTMEPLTSWDSPLVLSLTSFHGRVFFAGGIPITDWAARVGAIEAVIGLFIEIIFIATFSRRFLGD